MKIVIVTAILLLIVAIPFIMAKHKIKRLMKSTEGKWLLNEDSRYNISDLTV
jgi:hypothetical protein